MNKVLVIILAVCVAACAAVGVGVYVYTNDDTDEPQIPSDPSTDPPVDEPITPPEEPSVNPPVETPEGDFTVTFMMNSAVNSGVYLTVYVDEGETVAEPAEPEKPKATYVFVKWTTDKDNRNAYDFTTPVTGDLVLYADWDVMGTSSGSSSSGSSSSGNQHIEHNYEFVKTVDSNCTEEGYDLYKCSCGAEEKRNSVSATGHSEAFKTENGVNIIYCSVCGTVLESENVPNYVAQIGNNFYETLNAAHTKANNGDTIKLLGPVTTGTITKPVIIEVNGQTATLTYTDGNYVKIMGSAAVSLNNGMLVTLEVDAEGYNVTKSATDGTANLWIYTVSGLKDFRDAVNGGNSYSRWTVTLKNAIDLKNEEWAPIGDSTNGFKGTFDGNNKIISNLKITGTEYVGLFGYIDGYVTGVVVDSAEISGNHYVGTIVGYGLGGVISDCSVSDVTITVVPNEKSGGGYDNGDKVGGIVGYGGFADSSSISDLKVTDCTVTDVKLTAYRDVGGVVGAAGASLVTGNSAIRVTVTVDKVTNSYGKDDINGGTILGRSFGSGVLASQIATDCTVKVIISKGFSQVITDTDSYYEISDLDGLYYFEKTVNTDKKTYKDETVKLTDDITLAYYHTTSRPNYPKSWNPIGLNGDSQPKFQGTFDGQGYTIKNLIVDTPAGYTAAGFFGALNGVAKDFTIDDAVIHHISTGSATVNGVAVVAGSTAYGATIEDVHVKNSFVNGNRYVGGIAGYVDGTIKDCSVTDTELVAIPNAVSGGFENGDKVGGIAGYLNSGVVSISGNTVTNLDITAYRDAGGIVGCGNSGVTTDVIVGNSANNVKICIDQITNNYGTKDHNTGAIIGRINGGQYDETQNSYSDFSIVIPSITDTTDNGKTTHTLTNAPLSMLAVIANSADSGDTIVLTESIEGGATDKSGYGKSGLNLNGGILDGNAQTLTVNFADSTWDCAIAARGGTIQDLKVSGAMRGVFMPGTTADLYIKNVVFEDVIYTFNSDSGNKNYGVYISDSTLNGWTSFSDVHKEVIFTNCKFGEGNGYASCRPYNSCEFINCNFDAEFEIDLRATGTFKNCYLNGVLITDANIGDLVTSGTNNAIVNNS